MQKYKQKHGMYFLICFLVRVFGTIADNFTTEYLTPGYYRPVTGVFSSSLTCATTHGEVQAPPAKRTATTI